MIQPNPPVLTPAQKRYVLKAVRLRRRLTDKALAHKFTVSPETISSYAHGRRGLTV